MATKKKAAAKKAAAGKSPAKKAAAKKAAVRKRAAAKKAPAAKKGVVKRPAPAKKVPRKTPAAKKRAAPRAAPTTRGAVAGEGLAPGYQLVKQLVTVDGVLHIELDGQLIPLQKALAEGQVLAWTLNQVAGGVTSAEAIEQITKLLQFLEETQALQATISITCCVP